MKNSKSIFWFRNDLRLADNPGLYNASLHDNVIGIYIFDPKVIIGDASKLWLHHSLTSLNKSLNDKLNIYYGDPQEIIKNITDNNNITNIYWNRCYDKYSIERDSQIKDYFSKKNINVTSFNGSLLIEPWQCLKDDGTHYKVYTPFYKNLMKVRKSRANITSPKIDHFELLNDSTPIDNLEPINNDNNWQSIINIWSVGEESAINLLIDFLENDVDNYKEGRDFPSLNTTSRLSPYLHFGEISPNQIFNSVYSRDVITSNHEHFIRELVWRDFSYYQLYYYSDLQTQNINKKFDKFKWNNNKELLEKWQSGQTGIPIVDAGMRELWQTGYMHNRVRMIVASFLIKNCLIHWKEGEKWFFNTLFDADIASNNASWQWVAGCGLDAAPYFRIFNPVLQAQKFDKNGEYIRKYVPELNNIPDKYISSPWLAKQSILDDASVVLGKDYPFPIVDLKESRQKALDIYSSIK